MNNGKAAKHIVETIAKIIFLICAVVAIVAVLSITAYMFAKGTPALAKVGVTDLLFGTAWQPTADNPTYGIFYIICTSIIGTAVAIAIGVPVGILTAVFITEVSNKKLAAIVQPAVELLAAIPSVIYGLLGMMLLNPLMYKLEKHIFAGSTTHQFTGGANLLSAIIVLAIIVAIVVFVLVLNDAERRIPVQYSKKMQGRRMIGGQSTYIPLKVNTANVIPVIFASSIMSMPVMIAQFFHVDYSTIGGKILLALSSSNWFKPEAPAYSIGMLVYIVLVVLFAYFYTSITFNPLEVANNMKKSGGFIPGIRPGKPTSDYLNNILNYIVFIGACGLVIVCIIPIIASGLFSVGNLSFGGTSLIIIAGVILETIKAVESMMLVRNYKGFLND